LATANVRALDDLVAAHPGQVEALALDVMDTASIGETVQDICDRHGRSDVLVNNAGRSHVGAVRAEIANWEKTARNTRLAG
jgi:NADP-dependent 3-hydroxy acid dehydrogenase YdfG